MRKYLLHIIVVFLILLLSGGFFWIYSQSKFSVSESPLKMKNGEDLPERNFSYENSAFEKGEEEETVTEAEIDSQEEIKEEAESDERIEDNRDNTHNETVSNSEAAESDRNLLKFALIGDTQRGESSSFSGLRRAALNIQKQKADLVFALGDLVSSCDGKNGCRAKLNKWKAALGPLFAKTYVTMGNHDRTSGDKSDALFQNFFSFPTNGPKNYRELVYSFDHHNCHFVVLNSEKPKGGVINKEQRNWLEKDLAKNSKKNIFVFFHEPAYPTGSKIGESLDIKPEERNALWDILVKYKVKAVFSGHEHIVSRRKVKGVYQFVFGNTDSFNHDMPRAGKAEYAYRGKSFGLVEVRGSEITVKTFTVDGQLLNTFSFR